MSKINYAKMPEIKISKRTWPDQKLEKTPLWCAVDLRDGNQALPNPMTPEQKFEYFQLLVDIGFKEIEIGFPSASEDDFNFCRDLIEQNLIPGDVTISVLCQCRPHLITRTVEALKGVKKAVIHLYIATSDLHMKHVFKMNREQVVEQAVAAVKQTREESLTLKNSIVELEFSPEEFSDTDLDFSLEICDAVVQAWNPKEDEKVILNLPMTVERRLPNEYADMIEEFMRRNRNSDKTIISVHVHNDLGCAVAASTMALMAGAQRVEGTLFGHGERTGNLDLVTLVLNLDYLGVDTGLDFSNLHHITTTVEKVTDIDVHPRHPYSGQLVFTAFSGSHQDAIHKGFVQKDSLIKEFGGWKIPYLHVDPSSLGRKFEKFIRINSQSGKGGIAFIMEHDFHVKMPRWVQVDFASYVQSFADKASRELDSREVYDIFNDEYLASNQPIELMNYWARPTDKNPDEIEGELHIKYNGTDMKITGKGNGPISAVVKALRTIEGLPKFSLDEYAEDSMGHSADSNAICFVGTRNGHSDKIFIGAGIHQNVIHSAVKALICSINNLIKAQV